MVLPTCCINLNDLRFSGVAYLWILLILSDLSGVVQGQNVYVWPLGIDAMNIEVKGFGPVTSNSIGNITLKTGPTPLGYDAFAFEGTTSSYVELRVPDTTPIDGDFTVMFYVYLDSSPGGFLFRFQSDDVSVSDTLTGINMRFDSSLIKISFSGQTSGGWSGGMDTVDNNILTDQWVRIAMEHDYSTENCNFFINDVTQSLSGVAKNIPVGLPGTIRLGSLPTGPSLTGRVTCFIIQSGKYDKNNFLTDIQDCLTSNWQNTQACAAECPSYKGYFLLAQSGKAPLNSFPRLSSVTHERLTSRQCAVTCLENSSCVSFLFVMYQSTGHCETFAGDYSMFLETSTVGIPKYYVRKDKCCM